MVPVSTTSRALTPASSWVVICASIPRSMVRATTTRPLGPGLLAKATGTVTSLSPIPVRTLNIDTRTATEYGVVRTFFDATFNWGSGGSYGVNTGIAGGALGVYYAFIQFAGFTMGKAVSQFSSPWTGYPGNATSFLIGGEDDVTGINQFAYTASFGNGVSASVSLEDPSAYRQSNVLNTNTWGLGWVCIKLLRRFRVTSGKRLERLRRQRRSRNRWSIPGRSGLGSVPVVGCAA